MSLIFLPILPLGIMFSLVAFCVNYAVFKYKLLNKHKTPEQLASKVILFFSKQLPLYVYISILMLLGHVFLEHREAVKRLESGKPMVLDDYRARLQYAVFYAAGASIYMLIPI